MKKKTIASAVEQALPPSTPGAETPPAAPPMQIQIEEKATMLIRQMVNDHLNTLPPASREITATYVNQVMNRVVVLAAQGN